jgi:hypothetical protein
MSSVNRTVELYELYPGDHIYVWSSPVHHHHSIYIGEGKVIHFTARGTKTKEAAFVQQWTLQEFCDSYKSCEIKRVTYNVDSNVLGMGAMGTCCPVCPFPAPVVVERALSKLGNKGTQNNGYHVLYDNCEHFAMWCKTGGSCPSQARIFISPIHMTTHVVSGVVSTLADHIVDPRRPAQHFQYLRQKSINSPLENQEELESYFGVREKVKKSYLGKDDWKVKYAPKAVRMAGKHVVEVRVSSWAGGTLLNIFRTVAPGCDGSDHILQARVSFRGGNWSWETIASHDTFEFLKDRADQILSAAQSYAAE